MYGPLFDRHKNKSYLLSHKGTTVKGTVVIRPGAQKGGEVGEEADRGDCDGAVWLGGEDPAVEADGVLGLRAVLDGRVELVDEGVDVRVRWLHLQRRALRVHVVGADRDTAGIRFM